MSKELENKIAELEKANAELVASNNEKEAVIAEQNEVIEGLNAELGNLAKKKSVKQVVVKHNKKSYRVIFPQFNYKGEVHTAESLEKNKDLIAELVEIGFGGFEEVAE